MTQKSAHNEISKTVLEMAIRTMIQRGLDPYTVEHEQELCMMIGFYAGRLYEKARMKGKP